MSDICIREFREDDLKPVARVWHDSWTSTGLATRYVPTLDKYHDRLAGEGRRDWRIWVACSGSEIKGFLAFDWHRSWLRQLFVSPAVQRSGIGTMLLDVAKREMPNGFWLRTEADNESAKRFYERRGLRADGQFVHENWGFMTIRYRRP